MPKPKFFVVGRQNELNQFISLLKGEQNQSLLNIYGPSGTGKTVVAQMMQDYASTNNIPFALIDGIQPDLTPNRILYEIKDGVAKTETLSDVFRDFDHHFEEDLIIGELLQRGGGIQSMFDPGGNLNDQTGFAQMITSLGRTITEEVQRVISNRFALERYLRGAEKILTSCLSASLSQAVEKSGQSIVIIVDTYEELEGLDDWFCHILMPALPPKVYLVVLGQNALTKFNTDWGDYGNALNTIELPELAEEDAKAYLVYRGLRDSSNLEKIYRFTGGYPLLLVLVWHISRELGGWDKIGAVDAEADRDRMATILLERILREESVKGVQTFLEKGVIAPWFDPEIIGVVIGVNSGEASEIYNKLGRYSFVKSHPFGLKFYDKIRELLLIRLKFADFAEYQRLNQRLKDHLENKAHYIKQQLNAIESLIGNDMFISYSSKDKEFVERLAKSLNEKGVKVWWDKWEIKVGDSIIQKVSDGINQSAYLAAVLSPHSVKSDWVQRELGSALMIQLSAERGIRVLPLLISDCEIPILIREIKWADFRTDYENGLNELLRTIGQKQD